MLIALYLLIGFLGSRFVRSRFPAGRVGWKDERHNKVCDRNPNRYGATAKTGCNHYTGCSLMYNFGAGNFLLVVLTPLLWPLYLVCWFMLAEKLPKPAIFKSQTEKFNEALANDPGLKSIVDELHETYKVKV